jgi:Zn-dependent metalloprotease
MRPRTWHLTAVAAALIGAAGWFIGTPAAQSARAVDLSLAHFTANRALYGLSDPVRELRVRGSRAEDRGVTHVRFDQLYRGLPVFEGEAIAHVDADGDVTVTSALRGNLGVATTPRVGRSAAIAAAVADIAPAGGYQVRDASLWVLPRGEHSVADRLVWHVAVLVDNPIDGPAEWRHFVDARSGLIAWAYNDLQTGPVGGVARTMYSGEQAITVDQTSATKFLLRDPTRGSRSGNYTCDAGVSTGCVTFSRATSVFGNFLKDNSDRATAGADAHFGMQASWDYFKVKFGRNGINGAGKRTYSRVHYGVGYDNAFWSNSCFCMTYGDGGTWFYPLVSLDVAGHELTHGVTYAEARLTYSGESGGLNESTSDIFGTMVEFAVNSAADTPDYWIGERIFRANYPNGIYGPYVETTALRSMSNPPLDGRSPACWYSGLGLLDVHYSSGPNNHMFYLLAEGGTSVCNGQVVGGIGRDRAARIWYTALADYMVSSTNYHGARTAALNAAAALYGAGSPEHAAVAAAYSAINVN